MAFEKIATEAINRGAAVWIEWPKKCFYWNTGKVRAFLRKHNFQNTYIDGCMYGLIAKAGPNAGVKMSMLHVPRQHVDTTTNASRRERLIALVTYRLSNKYCLG